MQLYTLDAVVRLVTQAAGASARRGGDAGVPHLMAPACVRRFRDGRACPVHAAARLRCVSLGNIEAEPERARLLTVHRYNTVHDGAATRPAAPSRWCSTPASTRSASALTLPACRPRRHRRSGRMPAKLMRQPRDYVLNYLRSADHLRNNVRRRCSVLTAKNNEA
jgi:hypothetical protein